MICLFAMHQKQKIPRKVLIYRGFSLFCNSFQRRDKFYHLSFQTISQTRNILLITKLLQSKQKIKYLLISLHISLLGCIFGCQFSNTPNYEYQKKHHFRTGKPEEKRCANHRECAYPYACDIRKPAYRVYNGPTALTLPNGIRTNKG